MPAAVSVIGMCHYAEELLKAVVGSKNPNSDEPSHYGDNLPNHLSIAISELLPSMNSTGIEVNHQAVVLPAAAPADVGSVTFKNYRHAFSTVRNLRTLHESGA
ncbi:MAG TPA: hypothetical protein VNO32_37835 [Candidatus Acidoferrum sp.]|nr:hypothetical protein [Candidatus Acidoferrum sp.]